MTCFDFRTYLEAAHRSPTQSRPKTQHLLNVFIRVPAVVSLLSRRVRQAWRDFSAQLPLSIGVVTSYYVLIFLASFLRLCTFICHRTDNQVELVLVCVAY